MATCVSRPRPGASPLRKAAPRASLTAVNPKSVCKYMKMITLPKLRDSLRDTRTAGTASTAADCKHEVRMPAHIRSARRLCPR